MNLAPTTIRTTRTRSTVQIAPSNAWLGRDARVRPTITADGGTLLMWFQLGPTDAGRRSRLVEELRLHCLETIVMLARGQVTAWKDFINQLENRNAGVTENLSETA